MESIKRRYEMKKAAFLFTGVFAMVLLASFAWARHHGKYGGESGGGYMGGYGEKAGMMGMMGHEHGYFFREIFSKLDLTEDQTKKAERIKSSYKKETIKLGADIKVAEIELSELTSEETVNLEKVKGKIKEIEGLKARLRLYRIEKLEEFKKILDAKQLKKLREVFYKSHGYSSGVGGVGGVGGGGGECEGGEGVKEGEGEEGVE